MKRNNTLNCGTFFAGRSAEAMIMMTAEERDVHFVDPSPIVDNYSHIGEVSTEQVKSNMTLGKEKPLMSRIPLVNGVPYYAVCASKLNSAEKNTVVCNKPKAMMISTQRAESMSVQVIEYNADVTSATPGYFPKSDRFKYNEKARASKPRGKMRQSEYRKQAQLLNQFAA